MDWLANIDGITYLIDEIWPLVVKAIAEAEMCVVGKNPPEWLIKKVENEKLNWHFTGFVDSVKPFVKDSCVCLIPLRVGGGTRIKVFEAMAMGSPVVSTTIGVEGLPITADEHYLDANTPQEFANSMVQVMNDPILAERLSKQARTYVEDNFSQANVVRTFEQICLNTITK
jgi:glycosyltransferase involved in cell wall biosynthesis